MSKIIVQNVEINILQHNNQDYISLTDMVRNQENNHVIIGNWMRRKDTLEFLGYWETLYNPNFKLIEFDELLKSAGTNRFSVSPQQWIRLTNSVGIISKSGKNGGTFAHKDIAFEFGTWLSPVFKLLLIKEFQRLKDEEQQRLDSGWDVRRFIAKANYKIQTDSIAQNLIEGKGIPKEHEWIVYANEADIVNHSLFKMTAKEWKQANPKLTAQKLNMRDFADVYQLIVLSNLESINAEMIHQGIPKKERYHTLVNVASSQIKSLTTSKAAQILNADIPNKQLTSKSQTTPNIDERLTNQIDMPPTPKKDKK